MVSLLFGVDMNELVHRQAFCDGELIISGWPVHGHWPSLRSVTLTALPESCTPKGCQGGVQ